MNVIQTTIATVVAMIKTIATHPWSEIQLMPFGSLSVPTFNQIAFKVDLYAYGERLAVHLLQRVTVGDETWFEHLREITVNVPDASVAPGSFFVKTYGDNTAFRYPLLSQGWFEDTGDRFVVGNTHVEVWRPTQRFCDAFQQAHESSISLVSGTLVG